MTDAIDTATAREMVETAARRIIDSVDILTDADMAIGDGDHGVGMRRGFEGALEALASQAPATVDQVFKTVGTAVMSKTGGASGAVFGTWFRSGAKPLDGRDRLDSGGFAEFLEAGLEAVMKRGGVGVGQKTMIDALAPAALAAADHRGGSLLEAAAAVAAAAERGAEETRGMLATTGKARSLGERSLGHVDPGAISVTIILRAFSDFLARRNPT